MCIREELESVDYMVVGEAPVVDIPVADIPWTPPDTLYMRCMNAYKTRPSIFSVVGKTAWTVNLLEFFDWMDDQKKLKEEAKRKASQASPVAGCSGSSQSG